MVTPFTADGALDLDGASGSPPTWSTQATTGWSSTAPPGSPRPPPTRRKTQLVRAVLEAVGDRAHVVAGAATTTPGTRIDLARLAERRRRARPAAVTPYYNKPPQEGLFRHFTAIADATDLPVMIYDIPGRTGVPIETETLVRLAEHPRIVANKDAKGDLGRASWAIAQHRPRLVLRRRRAQPSAALGRRRRLRLRGRPPRDRSCAP